MKGENCEILGQKLPGTGGFYRRNIGANLFGFLPGEKELFAETKFRARTKKAIKQTNLEDWLPQQ